MKTPTIVHIIGVVFVAIAVIMHIVCLATPYYATFNLTDLTDDINNKTLSPTARQQIKQIAELQIKMTYGLWKLCYTAKIKDASDCHVWDDQVDPGIWLKGAQAMAILGVLVMGKGALLVMINLVVQSRGDRMRLIPYIICGSCVAGGICTFIGDMVFAANYKSLTNMKSDMPVMSSAAKDLLNSKMSLSWCLGLDIVSVVLVCVGGVLHILGRNKNDGSGMV